MNHTVSVDVTIGSQFRSFSWTTEDVESAQDELMGVFTMLRKAKKKAKKQGKVIPPQDWTTMQIVEKVDGGGVQSGGKHSDAVFNASIPKQWVDRVLDYFKNVDVD